MGGREIRKRKGGQEEGKMRGGWGRGSGERSEIDVETEMGKIKMEVQGGRGDGADPREKSPSQSPTNGPPSPDWVYVCFETGSHVPQAGLVNS